MRFSLIFPIPNYRGVLHRPQNRAPFDLYSMIIRYSTIQSLCNLRDQHVPGRIRNHHAKPLIAHHGSNHPMFHFNFMRTGIEHHEKHNTVKL